jgi:3-oxoacyl-[acyl-carrier protein] reductase
LTHAAAVEYADKKIRINAIGPTTGVETPMIQGWIESMPAQPSDIASACAFLLSEEACHITGHTLPVDL